MLRIIRLNKMLHSRLRNTQYIIKASLNRAGLLLWAALRKRVATGNALINGYNAISLSILASNGVNDR